MYFITNTYKPNKPWIVIIEISTSSVPAGHQHFKAGYILMTAKAGLLFKKVSNDVKVCHTQLSCVWSL